MSHLPAPSLDGLSVKERKRLFTPYSNFTSTTLPPLGTHASDLDDGEVPIFEVC
jgi:hypothetical protein